MRCCTALEHAREYLDWAAFAMVRRGFDCAKDITKVSRKGKGSADQCRGRYEGAIKRAKKRRLDRKLTKGEKREAAARKPSTGAEKAALYSENAAKCLAARDQAPSANRKRKSGSEAVDGGHFRSEANARKNSGKVKGEFKKRPERQREH